MYNGLISGIGLDGKSFFYTNAMQVKIEFQAFRLEAARSGWFDCSCCPTNLVRLIASIPGYMYAQKDDNLYVNLFISSMANIYINKIQMFKLYSKIIIPWDGDLKFTVNPKISDRFYIYDAHSGLGTE